MRILIDNCVDQNFACLFPDYEVVHARQMGWASLENGDLITKAEASGFQAIITVDKNLRYQQNISGRKISIIILESGRVTLRHIAPLADKVIQTLKDLPEGSYVTVKP